MLRVARVEDAAAGCRGTFTRSLQKAGTNHGFCHELEWRDAKNRNQRGTKPPKRAQTARLTAHILALPFSRLFES
jgi:hypothetical protein